MTNCRTSAVLRRIVVLLVVVAVGALSWLALYFVPKKSAHAEEVAPQAETQLTHDQVFGASHANSRPFSLEDEEIVFVEEGKYGWADKYFLKSSTFHLTEDVEISNYLQMIASYFGEDTYITVNICLHGHSLTYKSSYAIGLAGDCTLNIYDCGGDDNHSGSIRGINITNAATVNMYSGAIKDYTKDSGVSVYGYIGDKHATFNMYGGTITNNTITFKETDSDTVVTWYDGAGVYNNGGTFTMQGNVNISGNVKGKPSSLSANNVYLGFDSKIQVTGALGASSQIGITMPSDKPTGVITSGYAESGNTQDPSVFFNCDNSGYSISYDDLSKEAEVYEGEVVVGNYTMTAATATSHVGTPKVGDTSIGLNIEVSLKNTDDNSTKTIQDTKTVPCAALHVGSNTITYNYVYKGVTKPVTYTLTLDKVNAAVNWTCSGANSSTTNTAERYADGSNLLSGISASYLGYDGTNVTVSGTSLIVKKNGATVNSITEVGVYTITLPSSETYNYSNDTFTLTVKEAPVDEGYYTMRSATAVVNGTYTAGATSINVTVTATLKNTVNINDVTTATETKQITVTALKAGNNEITFTYTYTDEKGGTQTAQVTVNVTAGKKSAAVQWYFNGALASGNTAEYTSNGIDVKGKITAKYTGLNGQTVTVTDLDMIVKDSTGATVDSVIGAGVYTVSLAEKADYQFTNNSFTLTVNEANIEDGYYRMTTAVATGVAVPATVGDREITVAVKVSLEHTKNGDTAENTVNTKVTLATPLHVGNNTISFTYTHTSAPDDVQTKTLSLIVNAAKKQVALKWYYNGTLADDNTAVHFYDGLDAKTKIYAEYEGYDGTVQRVDGTSVGMNKKDADGNTVTALKDAGIYTLSLSEAVDYVFTNNLFTFTVAENLGNLTYEEDSELILGVSSAEGFEQGTEMVVEWVEDLDDSLVNGQISSALNVSFVNNATEVTPAGSVTVRVLIPDNLKGKDYKIYNLKDGVATELRFTADGDYATFTSDELNTILFVTQETPLPTPTPDGGNGSGIVLNNNGMVWVWVSVAIVAAALAIMSIIIVVLTKRRKK